MQEDSALLSSYTNQVLDANFHEKGKTRKKKQDTIKNEKPAQVEHGEDRRLAASTRDKLESGATAALLEALKHWPEGRHSQIQAFEQTSVAPELPSVS